MAVLLLVGATGLVGQSVLQQALADSRVSKVVAITRKPLPPQDGLENPLVDFDALPDRCPLGGTSDAGICTLGTTMRQAGSTRPSAKSMWTTRSPWPDCCTSMASRALLLTARSEPIPKPGPSICGSKVR